MDLVALISFQEPSFRRGQLPIMYTIQQNGCHNCISHAQSKGGYPRVSRNRKPGRMSRLIYTLCKGEIPPGLVVRHTCDNPLCINPEHLILGTVADNNHDRVLRNRSACGERNGKSKLKAHEIVFILESQLPTSQLAEIFHVNPKTIWGIRKRLSWRHVTISKAEDVRVA